jgi:hypothetical protein
LAASPGIAALAAGTIAALAALVLVARTLFEALPVHRYGARKSPDGEGSIAMVENLLAQSDAVHRLVRNGSAPHR